MRLSGGGGGVRGQHAKQVVAAGLARGLEALKDVEALEEKRARGLEALKDVEALEEKRVAFASGVEMGCDEGAGAEGRSQDNEALLPGRQGEVADPGLRRQVVGEDRFLPAPIPDLGFAAVATDMGVPAQLHGKELIDGARPQGRVLCRRSCRHTARDCAFLTRPCLSGRPGRNTPLPDLLAVAATSSCSSGFTVFFCACSSFAACIRRCALSCRLSAVPCRFRLFQAKQPTTTKRLTPRPLFRSKLKPMLPAPAPTLHRHHSRFARPAKVAWRGGALPQLPVSSPHGPVRLAG